MTKIQDFAKTATENNAECVRAGLGQISNYLYAIRSSLSRGERHQVRIETFKALYASLGLAIAADGRQSMIEDLLGNQAELAEKVDPRAAAVLAALDSVPLSRYSEDDCNDTEDSDDPDSCDGDEDRRPWYKAPAASTVVLPPEPTPEQKAKLEAFFRGLQIVPR